MASLKTTFDKLMVVEHAAQVMVYFEKFKILEIITRLVGEITLVRPKHPQRWMGKNIRRIADEIYNNCMANSFQGTKNVNFFLLPGRFLYRIVIFGPPGSGRKTQGITVAKHFKLIYLNAENVIAQNLTAETKNAKKLQKAFAENDMRARSIAVGDVINDRVLQMDALRHGWVLVNYPTDMFEFEKLLENSKVPPNKMVYLKCPERIAMKRLANQTYLGQPQDNFAYMEHMMVHFKKNEKEVDDYLSHRFETLYVDAGNCFESVRISVMSQLERIPYVTGYKQ